MDKPQPFVVPAGVNFQITDAGVVIENEGDIVLHTNFGRTLTRIVSTAGSITIHAPVEGGVLHAAGDIAIQGDTHAEQVKAGGSVTVSGNARVGTLSAGAHVAVHGDAEGARIEAGGDVGVTGAASVTSVRAGGTVDLAGAVKADSLHAAVLRFASGPLTARGIQGSQAIHIGAARLQVDAIIAPAVHLDPATSGRATVIESQNDLGPNAIKGGFRLADYAEMFGDPASFLADRGLAPLGSAPAPVLSFDFPERTPVEPAPVVAAPVVAPPAPAVQAPVEEAPVEIEIAEATTYTSEAAEPVGDPATAQAEPLPVEMEVEEDEPSIPPEHPLHKQLMEAVTRISESYADAELPPAVNHLMSLIETRAYDQVRAEITSIWSDLLKYHQKKGLRIQHQVTTTFNTINSLVKKM